MPDNNNTSERARVRKMDLNVERYCYSDNTAENDMEPIEHHSPISYADLQPLQLANESTDSEDDNQQNLDLDQSHEGPALAPIKEEVVSIDLRSFFLGKGNLFDEPQSLPIICAEVSAPDNDSFLGKMIQTKEIANPTSRQLFKKEHLERKVACRHCDRMFLTIGHMKIHAASHLRRRNINKSKLRVCHFCGRAFKHGGALCLHMRIHEISRAK